VLTTIPCHILYFMHFYISSPCRNIILCGSVFITHAWKQVINPVQDVNNYKLLIKQNIMMLTSCVHVMTCPLVLSRWPRVAMLPVYCYSDLDDSASDDGLYSSGVRPSPLSSRRSFDSSRSRLTSSSSVVTDTPSSPRLTNNVDHSMYLHL